MDPRESDQIKRFTRKASLLCLPFALLIALGLAMDPFRVWFTYEDPYKDTFVTLNRSWVLLKLLERNGEKAGYNSFIFGSSRSQAFKVPEWEKRLGPGAEGFHFDSFSEGIYGFYTKIRYLKAEGYPIHDALIILDHDAMTITKNHSGHTIVSPPELSGESPLSFYLKFLRAGLDLEFVAGYLDYRCFHRYRGYMKRLFNDPGIERIYDIKTGDLAHLNERWVHQDEEGYYAAQVKKGVFYDRKKLAPKKEKPVSPQERKLLEGIRDLLTQDRTRCKIVVSPLYDQVPLGGERLALLRKTFGAGNVFDFSGVNAFTGPVRNYYEALHYRPHVANEIMDIVYGRPPRGRRP